MAIIIGCACDTGNGNTLTPNCIEGFDLTTGVALQNQVNGTGALNSIDLTSAIGSTFYDLFFSTDATQRLFPISGLRNVDWPKEETQYDTDNTNQKDFLRDGTQSFMAEKRGANNVYASKVQQSRCPKNGTYWVSEIGVVGLKVSTYGATPTHNWYPIPITALDAQWKPKTGSEVEKVMVSFDLEATVNVGELWLIKWEDLGMTYQQFVLAGLLDVNYTITNAISGPTPTAFSLRITSDYGQGLIDGAKNVAGLVAGDFAITNKTAGGSITPTSVTENTDDDYDFVIPDQTTGDIVNVAMASSSSNPFDGNIDLTAP